MAANDRCALSKKKASLESTTCTSLFGHPLFERTLGESRERPALCFRLNRGRCCWPLLYLSFSHTIESDSNLNLMSYGFLFDIANLLLIVDNPSWHSYPKIVPQSGKECYIAGVPSVYSNTASVRARLLLKKRLADTRLLFELRSLFESGFF